MALTLCLNTKMKQADQPFGYMLVKAFSYALDKM